MKKIFCVSMLFVVANFVFAAGDFETGYKKFRYGNDAAAIKAWTRSCNIQKNPDGCFGLAFMYSESKKIRRDYKKAKMYFKKACDMGRQNGCKEYKKLARRGK